MTIYRIRVRQTDNTIAVRDLSHSQICELIGDRDRFKKFLRKEEVVLRRGAAVLFVDYV